MIKKIETFDLAVRNTLEYAEAMELLSERNQVQRLLAQLDEEIKSVGRISPLAVEMARKNISARAEETAQSPERMFSDSAPDSGREETTDARLMPSPGIVFIR
jgi:hypothetical protein